MIQRVYMIEVSRVVGFYNVTYQLYMTQYNAKM